MSDEKALTPIDQRTVDFYGDPITAVLVQTDEGEQVFVPVRPICDFLGVSWTGQRRRINRDPVLSQEIKRVNVTFTDSRHETMPREVLCLPLDFLNGFLFGLNPTRAKEEVREQLIRYQRECYRILASAFLDRPATAVTPQAAKLMQLKETVNQVIDSMIAIERRQMSTEDRLERALNRAALAFGELRQRLTAVERQIRAGNLTEEQAREVQHRVNLIAQELAKRKPGEKHYPGIYEALRHETGATSYKSIPPAGYQAAIEFLDNWLKAIQQASTESDKRQEAE